MISEYVQINWKLPKVEKGQEIRFLYFDKDMNEYRGFRGFFSSKRHLSHQPISQEIKDKYPMKRGSILYKIVTPQGKCLSFYNQRMFNMEIIK